MIASTDTSKWTYERMIHELPQESRYEIRNFDLIDMPSPSFTHQNISRIVLKSFEKFIDEHQSGILIFAPFDVILDKGNTVQPDLLFISKENQEIIKEKGVFGSPDLVVEIVSKGSVIRDYIEKKEDYERFGVKEYWIIDPQNEALQVFTLDNTKYKTFSTAEEEGSVKSKILEGFELQWSNIFG